MVYGKTYSNLKIYEHGLDQAKVKCQWICKRKIKIFWPKRKHFDWNISDTEKFYKLESFRVAALAFQKKLQ